MVSTSEEAKEDAQPLKPKAGERRTTRPSRCPKINRIRRKIDKFIHDKKVEYVIIALIIADALIVLFELLIDLKVFGEHAKVGKAPEVLHIISIVILSFFVIELGIKIFALGPKFFKSVMNVIDGVIIIVSFIMDILFMKNEEWHDLIGLLIVLRLWRVVRIVNGIVQTVREEYEIKLEDKEKKIEKLEKQVHKLKSKLAEHGETVDDDDDDSESGRNDETDVQEKVEVVVVREEVDVELKVTNT